MTRSVLLLILPSYPKSGVWILLGRFPAPRRYEFAVSVSFRRPVLDIKRCHSAFRLQRPITFELGNVPRAPAGDISRIIYLSWAISQWGTQRHFFRKDTRRLVGGVTAKPIYVTGSGTSEIRFGYVVLKSKPSGLGTTLFQLEVRFIGAGLALD